MRKFTCWLVDHARAPSAWLSHVTAGVQPQAAADGAARHTFEQLDNGLAVVHLVGPLAKDSWVEFWGGTSTAKARHAIALAAADKSVPGIYLRVDSPGGEVAGTQELADVVAAASKRKPVHAHIEDLGASAAYWVASQASRVTANATAEVGSIGTVAVVEDVSEMAEEMGIRVHVVSTGTMKGAFVPGTEITEEQLAYLQERVDSLNSHFLGAVTRGRGLRGAALAAVSDGRVWGAEEARGLGLLDAVENQDVAFASFARVVDEAQSTRRRTTRRAAEDFVDRRAVVLREAREFIRGWRPSE